MPQRQHLFSLRLGHALRDVLTEGYDRDDFLKDLIAGATVGVIAIPLAMALAIASGVPPQYGLYTAIIAGAIVALAGGSRYSISGPTAAFVVILQPLTMKYGLAGLLLASTMAGVILIGMAYARLGRFIEYIPESVTLGFTGGIAIVIAVLQVPDVAGLELHDLPEHFIGKIVAIATHLPEVDLASALTAGFTLAIMLVWPRLRTPVPPHLPALVMACLLGVFLAAIGMEVDTIGSRFHYLLDDGTQAAGIPPFLPVFEWPWNRVSADGQPLALSFALVTDLLLLRLPCWARLNHCFVPLCWMACLASVIVQTANCWLKGWPMSSRPFSVASRPRLQSPDRPRILKQVPARPFQAWFMRCWYCWDYYSWLVRWPTCQCQQWQRY